LKHRSAGRTLNRGYPRTFRERVLRLVRKKYGGAVDERFGPTLAAGSRMLAKMECRCMPRRSTLRAAQGCAPDQANDNQRTSNNNNSTKGDISNEV